MSEVEKKLNLIEMVKKWWSGQKLVSADNINRQWEQTTVSTCKQTSVGENKRQLDKQVSVGQPGANVDKLSRCWRVLT